MERKSQITESELLDFFNGKLSTGEEREILEWKEACDENRKLFDTVRKQNLVMREVVRARLIKGDYSSIRGRIGGRRRRTFKLWYGVAAAAVVVAVISSVVLWRDASSVDESRTMAYIGPPARKAILEMADGGQHYLGGSGIKFEERDGAQVAISNGKVVYDKKLEEYAEEEKEDVLVYNKITIPRGAGLYRISLNDGSVVWLNSDSSLEYPEKFA